ncbi:FxSxx-COOH system tetratricopeptide repeat protein [Streptomyces sp. VNUA116]|uniref:FxSxx-COOH system tetratricopeptide repeat protein n=1 Tax=Streptomyces sp. VNUA116 TaxID=3062449 RepID=UPI002674D1F6|nr:FxSxx-COOH system tetratricopeptide repeat protein [Streptomyces sp. VNUA116]WKU48811.1 FxSxx-COOH system tetratricopeptide repeat protein [Streptomyces sp. VNUA116]
MPDTRPQDRPGSCAVFLATSENLGLSTTLRNTADILAEGNRSVLLVDGRPGATGGATVPEPGPGRVATVARTTPHAFAALGDDPVAARYDHILIEAPVPDAPGAVEPGLLVDFADAIVVCFALTAWSIDGAAALAEDLSGRRRAGLPVRLLALGLKSDPAVRDRLREGRERVRRKFSPLARARGESMFPFLEIPYNPLYQDSRSLAVETEGAGTVTGLRPAYERLADWLLAHRTTRPTAATIVHFPRHAPWAAWLRERLAEQGVRTELRRGDIYTGESPEPGRALLFLAPGDADDTLRAQIGALNHTDVRIVLVDEPFPEAEAAHHERIDLRETSEDEALQALYAGLGLGPARPGEGSAAARFPRLPAATNVAPRNRGFVDRDDLLTALEERLRTAGREGAGLVLHGPGGWGKSETARELCHRYGPGYDVVWWVRAWGRERIRRGLRPLSALLCAPEERRGAAPEDDGVARLLTRLSRPGTDSPSWLIVYDGVEDPADLEGLTPVPHERGHVLITSRSLPAERQQDGRPPYLAAFPLGPLTVAEAHLLLSERVAELTAEQAQQVGSVVGFVPLALQMAARCLAEKVAAHHRDDHMSRETSIRAAVADLCAAYRTAKTELLAETDGVSPVAVMVRVAREIAAGTPGAAAWRNESTERDALGWLLNAASLLTGRGMGLDLLRSRRILSELAGDDLAGPEQPPAGALRPRHPDEVQLPDEHMVSVALWSLAQVGLLDVDFDNRDQPLAQHHALRDVIRNGMSPTDRAHIESVLRGVLAEYRRQDEDLPPGWAREVYSLRLWEDTRPRVRRSLLRHLQALASRGEAADLARLLDIADRARACWRHEGDEHNPEYLRLLNLTAQAHRLSGAYGKSRELAQEALRGHRRLLGLMHPRTLLSADSYAATLRRLGRFDDALMQSRPTLEGLTLLLGPQHPATVQVQHNLALTEALTGRIVAALGRVLEHFRYRQAVGGQDDPDAWLSADLLAYLYRATGQDGESQDLLRQRLRRHGDTWDRERLRTEVGLAISERRLADGFPAAKDPRYGFEMAYERDQRALEKYVRRFGADRYDTLRCRFSLAADLHALGKAEDAEQQARAIGEALAALFGTAHPCTALSDVRHGVYLRATGDLEQAEAKGRSALDRLTRKLGLAHPWIAAAENSLAATLAAAGRTEEAAAVAGAALARLRDLGAARRPDGRRVRAHHAWLTGTERARPVPASGFDIDLELPGL